MISPDVSFAQFFNATTQAYVQKAPAYMTYRERTHIDASGPFVRANRDVNRMVMLRQKDNFAIMQDLPNGGTTQGQAWPIIPYFDPLSNFGFSYFVNLKAINITIDRSMPPILPLAQPDSSVDAVIYYLPFFKPSYLPGSTDTAPRFKVELVKPQKNLPYPNEVDIDPATGLPSHIDIKIVGDNLDVALDYSIVEGHWLITHGLTTSVQGPFHGTTETTYDQFTFPTTAPDPRLQ